MVCGTVLRMTTDELYARDAYLTTTEVVVAGATVEGVLLDRSVFYPRGGGQPGDTGTIRWDGGEVHVADTVKRGADVLHVLDEGGSPPPEGVTAIAAIDWDRRHRLMRTHTALHALSGIVFADYGARVTGGNMEPGVARMDFELEQISQEFGREVEQKLNAALAEDRPVHVGFLPRAEALADPDLIRTKVNLIPDHVDPIRVIDIEGIDKQADGGTHVRSTAEVGAVRVVKTESKGKGFKRMRIELVD
jgi:misacylated tRNA(Ala) deacylase